MNAVGDVTCDAFLGGRVSAWQPRNGFRSGVDAVLLAASVPAQAGQTVLELGCGTGVAALCLAARVPGLAITGVELQPEYAALATRNAQAAGGHVVVVEADLGALPLEIRQMSYDHVMMNPPYFIRARGFSAPDAGRDVARGGETPMETWLDVAVRRLRPAGVLSLIQKADRLPEVLAALDDRLGAVEVLPLAPRDDQPAGLFLLRAVKGRKTPFQLRPTIIMHKGLRHGDAGDGYMPMIEDVLRNGQMLAGYAEFPAGRDQTCP